MNSSYLLRESAEHRKTAKRLRTSAGICLPGAGRRQLLDCAKLLEREAGFMEKAARRSERRDLWADLEQAFSVL